VEILKTMVSFSGHDEGSFHLMDTIWHDGHWWLVASWLASNDTGMRTPERIIRMDGVFVKFQEVQNQEYRFLLNNALPISVVDGKTQDGYVVAIHPAAANIQGPKSVH
jgi:hypothetical protein